MDLSKMPKNLPEMEYAFDLDIEGVMTRKRYQGHFKFRIPTMRTRMVASKEQAKLDFISVSLKELVTDPTVEIDAKTLGQALASILDPEMRNFNGMVAYLRHTLIEAPEWWAQCNQGYDLHDGNVVTALYLKVLMFEKEWMTSVWGEADGKANEGTAAQK